MEPRINGRGKHLGPKTSKKQITQEACKRGEVGGKGGNGAPAGFEWRKWRARGKERVRPWEGRP